MQTNKKQYGLSFPKKGTGTIPTAPVNKHKIFNNSDSEEDTNVDWLQKALKKETYGGGALSRQSRANVERIQAEDPTVYQYDEIYDEMVSKRTEAIAEKKADKKPKYMHLLLAQAERRKREDERRKERQIQKEREAEGDQFADKESFVTSAYKKKLEELKMLEEEEKRQNLLEEIGEVTKQKDLSGFYRYIYSQTVVDSNSNDEKKNSNDVQDKINKITPNPARQYRKHVSESESASENEANSSKVEDSKKAKVSPRNDQKLKHSRMRESIFSGEEKSKKNRKDESVRENVINVEDKLESSNIDADSESSSDEKNSELSSNEINDNKNKITPEKLCSEDTKESEHKKEVKPKRSLWEKRTVGEVFDAALQRYYERKANALSVPVS